MSRYDFLTDSYRTERLKTLSVWAQLPDDRMTFRPEARARTPHEHMVHQCMSEDGWMRTMLGITTPEPVSATSGSSVASATPLQSNRTRDTRRTSHRPVFGFDFPLCSLFFSSLLARRGVP